MKTRTDTIAPSQVHAYKADLLRRGFVFNPSARFEKELHPKEFLIRNSSSDANSFGGDALVTVLIREE